MTAQINHESDLPNGGHLGTRINARYHNTAALAVALTADCETTDARHRACVELGGKWRTRKGTRIGYRFPDGSAVTVDLQGYAIEFLSQWPAELRRA